MKQLPMVALLQMWGLLSLSAQQFETPTSQMEKLNRGIVAIPQGDNNFISWRLLGTDPKDVTFDVMRDNKTIAKGLTRETWYTDTEGNSSSSYRVIAKQNGKTISTSAAATPWKDVYMQIPLNRPAGNSLADGTAYEYRPNDCSVGDVDGDGEYEIILKWEPTISKDNGDYGRTGRTLIDCYKLDGTQLWRIDMGQNIRSGAHYTQFMVFDFDGDGKAEMMCKTAPGTIDGTGMYVNQAATDETIKSKNNTLDWTNNSGFVLKGQEYLTVFNGLTGQAIHTVFYNPNRGMGLGGATEYTSDWGDSYGNRGDRFLACVAYLDGSDKNPSAVFTRGYYTHAYLWAVDFDGKELSTKWLHGSVSTKEWWVKDGLGEIVEQHTDEKNTCFAQGCHNISVADVDNDGCDEIIFGGAAVDNDGRLMYSTGSGHGDAQHLSDLDPDRPGLEFFMVLEDNGGGFHIRDAKTGELLLYRPAGGDTGRGMAADIDSRYRGFEYWHSASSNTFNIVGDSISRYHPSYVFRIYWDGDLLDELLGDISNHNSPYIEKWRSEGDGGADRIKVNNKNIYEIGSSKTCNGTKGTPCLQADLFGDWREEIICYDGSDYSHLNVFSSTVPTNYRVPTLMHDHTYRMGICWQNVGYNQPPHLGYYLPDRFNQQGEDITAIKTIAEMNHDNNSDVRVFDMEGRFVGFSTSGLATGMYIVKQGTETKKIFLNR